MGNFFFSFSELQTALGKLFVFLCISVGNERELTVSCDFERLLLVCWKQQGEFCMLLEGSVRNQYYTLRHFYCTLQYTQDTDNRKIIGNDLHCKTINRLNQLIRMAPSFFWECGQRFGACSRVRQTENQVSFLFCRDRYISDFTGNVFDQLTQFLSKLSGANLCDWDPLQTGRVNTGRITGNNFFADQITRRLQIDSLKQGRQNGRAPNSH